MTARERVDAFEAWVRRVGTPAEIASFSRSVADGFVAVAGSGAVTAAHVEMSCALARDAGMDVGAMERLGALFVRFTAEPAAAAAVVVAERAKSEPPVVMRATSEPPVVVRATSEPPVVMRASSEPPAPVVERAKSEPPAILRATTEPPTGDLKVSFRAAASNPALVALPDEPEPDAPPAPAARSPRAVAATRRGRLVALAAAVAAAAAIAYYARGSAPDDAPAHTGLLAALDLDAEFPAGWHVAPTAASASAVKSSLVARGGTDADPDDRAFVATVPRTDLIAPGASASDEALVKAAERAEHASAARVTAAGGTYQTGGCTASAAAAHTAVCRGTMHDSAGTTLALQTFVRIGDERAVVALFVAKLTVSDAAHEADAIVASLEL